jgi:AcrR family transcriptional regulator
MAGLRERKKEQTRCRIEQVAMRLFAERGFDDVTVNEIAEAAEVAKVTLFKYFPSKESLVLDGVKEDFAGIVAARQDGRSVVDAVRDHCALMVRADAPEVATLVRIISGSPALLVGWQAVQAGQRAELAAVLAAERDEITARLMAAQLMSTVTALQELFFEGRLTDDAVERAFDLLENGMRGH